MFSRKVDTKQAAVFIALGLVAAALLPAEFNPIGGLVTKVKAAVKKASV